MAGDHATNTPLTYAAAGVASGAGLLSGLLQWVRRTEAHRQGRVGEALIPNGYFASVLRLTDDLALAIGTDGVGSKILIAERLGNYRTIGIDCVAMNVNDVLCVGAEPVAMVDYLVMPAPDAELAARIAVGLSEGARQANVTIVGGETAIMPELVRGVDLAGTALGFVRRERVIDGGRIQAGDVILGLESSGLHSNGYTLARRILAQAGVRYTDPTPFEPGQSWGDALLTPTRIYVKAVLELLAAGVPVHGLAHITGGGLTKLSRLTKKWEFLVDAPLKPPPVFTALQKLGGVETREMYRTFNMGMGFAAIVPEAARDDALRVLNKHCPTRAVGRMAVGSGVWVPSLDLRF